MARVSVAALALLKTRKFEAQLFSAHVEERWLAWSRGLMRCRRLLGHVLECLSGLLLHRNVTCVCSTR
jgi:hypothetical protein